MIALISSRCKAFISVYYAYMLEYRAEIILWMIAGAFPFVMMEIWAQHAGQALVSGIDRVGFYQYFFAVFLVRQLTVVWVVFEMQGDVLLGRLSSFLMHPIDPAWRHVAKHVAERLTRVPFLVGGSLLFFVIYPEALRQWRGGVGDLLLAGMAITLVFMLRFVMQHSTGILAFWTERASAIESFAFLPYVFLSGMLAPLDLFGQGVRTFAYWTPYPYMIDFPAKLITGYRFPQGMIAWHFMILCAWFLGMLIFNRVLWRLGLKKYSGMGA